MHLMGHSRTILTFGYALAACACLLIALRERRAVRRQVYPTFWFMLTVVLAALAVQQYTHVLNVVTQIGRVKVVSEGLYLNRNALQHVAMQAALVVMGALGCGLLWLFRRAWRRYLPGVCALVYVVSYGLIQAISEHYMDRFLRTRVILPVKVWGDLVGIGLVLAAVGWTLVLDRDEKQNNT